jgi:hypothetical protein
MKPPERIDTEMLAPCGLNCMLCARHLGKNPCPGCRARLSEPDTYRRKCVMRACTAERGYLTCAECAKRPCKRMKAFAKRYQEGYGVDLGACAAELRIIGAVEFLRRQLAGHTCPVCGHMIDLHFGRCSGCGTQYPIGKGRQS